MCAHRFDNEIGIRQSVEGDIAGLKKVLDDTNISRINIENEIDAVKEELLFLKKNHENVSLQIVLSIESAVKIDFHYALHCPSSRR